MIKLFHVARYGGAGHHVQNWFAYHRAPSAIGRIAGVDCVHRIGMSLGNTMSDGWAHYAVDLMEELGYFTPAERAAVARERVRAAARAVIDIEFHQGTMTYGDAVHLLINRVHSSLDSARMEVARISMFPGTGVAAWLGASEIHALREEAQGLSGAAFSLKAFHDAFLAHGSIPVSLAVARLRRGLRVAR
jgi:uncharacterized protein (DUF885 family)